MKKIFIAGFILLTMASSYAQKTGVSFEVAHDWTEILAKAKASHKYIFVDCYTTWCGPCLQMSKFIFPLASVGAFMNAHFVNVQVQMDTTGSDRGLVKGWYADAHQLMTKHKITIFPTFLIFSADGKILHRVIGSILDSTKFITAMTEALNPDNQFYFLQELYKRSKDPSLIPKLVKSAYVANESPEAISGDFIQQLSDPFTKENMEIIKMITHKTTDKGYELFLHNRKKVDSILGEDATEVHLTWILWNEYVVAILKRQPSAIDWNAEKQKIAQVSDWQLADEAIKKGKYNYYAKKDMWPEYEKALLDYLNSYGRKFQPYQLNNFLWNIFLHTTDSTVLTSYLPWAKFTFEADSLFSNGMDTYANLLYKLGRTSEALDWENKAIQVAKATNNPDQVKDLAETVDKMKKGVKTWESF